MAFDELLRALTRRADADVAALLASAQDQAAALRRDGDRRCAERSAARLSERSRALTDDTGRALADALRAARLAELSAKIRVRDRVLAAARGRLAAANRAPGYRALLPGRFAAAAAVVGGEPARVRCAPDLQPVLAPLAAPLGNLRLEPDPRVVAGYVIESDDGRVTVDESLEHRLSAEIDELGQLALRALEQRT